MGDSYTWKNLVALHTNPITWAEEGFQLFSSAFENSKEVNTQQERLKKQIAILRKQEKRYMGDFLKIVTRMMALLQGFGSYLIQNITLICR